ncbi:MAG TPA: nucleotidyltransferase family protein [Nitrososphaerales archaeon]|nr:nucleotidyltransferase family protein [Nitrososphaerales archaeon]
MRPTTRAAILCGGRGERLKPLTDYFQKVMIPIGPKKLPLLAYTIALVRHHGIDRVTLLTGYRSEDIRRYFGDGSQHRVKLTYSEDKKGLPGSLNAVANALGSGAISKCDELLVYYGDVLTDLEITELLAVHRRSEADLTLVLDKGYALPVGVAEIEGGVVTSFHEKPRIDLSVTTGTMVAGPKAMALMRKTAGPKRTDLMTDFVPELLRKGGRIAPFYTRKEWFDVGTVSSFEKLNEELVRHPLSYLV